ncbi:MAG: K(+)-transporting ATPase subunit F [Rhodospirillales bacterium]
MTASGAIFPMLIVEDGNARHRFAAAWRRVSYRRRGLPARLRESVMTFDLILGGAVSLGLLIYLITALLRPERF